MMEQIIKAKVTALINKEPHSVIFSKRNEYLTRKKKQQTAAYAPTVTIINIERKFAILVFISSMVAETDSAIATKLSNSCWLSISPISFYRG
ncbi:hypothetical protein ACSZNT_17785 [Aeromonas veronii]|uniref:hypothetical protein n=1 Tax=Aeromonas veronii TaxID=654 RepID=UPI003007A5EE